MKRVLIGGAVYGWHNIGDDGLLRGILEDLKDFPCGVVTQRSQWLKEEYPLVRQFESHGIYRKPRLGCWFQDIWDPNSWKKSLFPDRTGYKWSDMLICGGGTIFSACPWNAYRMQQLEKAETKPTIIWGAGMCEERDPAVIDVIKKLCNDSMVLKIFVRDEFVRERLLNIGVDENKLDVCYDPAYILEPTEFDIDRFLTDKAKKIYLSDHRKLVLTLSGESDISEKVDLNIFRKFISKAADHGFEIFLIPLSYSNYTKDRYFLSELEKTVPNHAAYIAEEFHPKELIDFLAHMDVVISSRLHMSIYSTIAGTPFISLKRNEKNSDLANLFGMPCYGFDEITGQSLYHNTIELAEKKETDYGKRILKQSTEYRNIHIQKVEELKKIILSL